MKDGLPGDVAAWKISLEEIRRVMLAEDFLQHNRQG
jgi:hypothetical protein